VISHNTVAYEPYGGINLGWGWGWQSSCSMQSAQGLSTCRHGTDYAGGNQIVDNSISNVMLVLRDNAFIYTLGGQGGGNGTLTSVISGNYGNGQGGVYPDEGSSYWQIQNNVWNITSGPASWTYIWTPTVNNITYGTNYSNVGGYTNNGTNVHFVQATVVSNGQWPSAAQSIINNAGTSGTVGGNTVTVTNPGNTTGTVGQAVTGPQIQATDSAAGQTLTYSATGLPTGLSISSSGLITGTPSAAGTYTVTVTATDTTGAAGAASFTWTISGTSGGFPSGYNQLVIAKNSLCLDEYGNNSTAGSAIDQWTCNNQSNQKFQFVPTSGGYGELQVQNSGQDVTVLNSSTAQGQTDIVQEPVNGNAASLWLPQQQSDGSWQFKNQNSGLCLDVYGNGSNTGQQLDQWPCKNQPGTNQDFNPR